MNTVEFSNEFDILYNNITSNLALPLDEYEKSVFLTDAQDLLVKMYFSNKLNPSREGFDDSERRIMDFSSLITVDNMISSGRNNTVDSRAVLYKLRDGAEDIMFPLNFNLKVNKEELRIVIPMHYKEYIRLMSRPYKYPLKNQAWAILADNKPNEFNIELITRPNDKVVTLRARYIKYPTPIVLEDLEDGLTVRGVSKRTECQLEEIVHREILKQAVILAKTAYLSTGQQPQQSKEE